MSYFISCWSYLCLIILVISKLKILDGPDPLQSGRSTNKLSSTMPHQTWEKWVFNSQKRDYPAYYNLIWAGTHQHFNQLCCNCWYELEHYWSTGIQVSFNIKNLHTFWHLHICKLRIFIKQACLWKSQKTLIMTLSPEQNHLQSIGMYFWQNLLSGPFKLNAGLLALLHESFFFAQYWWF